MATTFLEQQVEAAIVSAINTAMGGSGTAFGFWQPATAGTVKQGLNTHVAVRVSVRENKSQNSSIIYLPVSITIKCSCEDSPSGDSLIAMTAPVMGLLHAWNLDSAVASAALSVANVFRADGLKFEDGGDPDLDLDLGVWYCPIQIKLSGAILP